MLAGISGSRHSVLRTYRIVIHIHYIGHSNILSHNNLSKYNYLRGVLKTQ